MRVYPECVYLRLEPSVTLISHSTGKVRSTPGVEVHWKDGRKWVHRTFIASDTVPTMGAILVQLGELLDSHPDLDAALAAIGARG